MPLTTASTSSEAVLTQEADTGFALQQSSIDQCDGRQTAPHLLTCLNGPGARPAQVSRPSFGGTPAVSVPLAQGIDAALAK